MFNGQKAIQQTLRITSCSKIFQKWGGCQKIIGQSLPSSPTRKRGNGKHLPFSRPLQKTKILDPLQTRHSPHHFSVWLPGWSLYDLAAPSVDRGRKITFQIPWIPSILTLELFCPADRSLTQLKNKVENNSTCEGSFYQSEWDIKNI